MFSRHRGGRPSSSSSVSDYMGTKREQTDTREREQRSIRFSNKSTNDAWKLIRRQFKDEPKLKPGTPLYGLLSEGGWCDNTPESLFDRLFDAQFRSNVEAFYLQSYRMVLICRYIIWYIHYRERASEYSRMRFKQFVDVIDHSKEKDSDTSDNWRNGNGGYSALYPPQPPVPPIRKVGGYAWKLFRTNVTKVFVNESLLADENALRNFWLREAGLPDDAFNDANDMLQVQALEADASADNGSFQYAAENDVIDEHENSQSCSDITNDADVSAKKYDYVRDVLDMLSEYSAVNSGGGISSSLLTA